MACCVQGLGRAGATLRTVLLPCCPVHSLLLVTCWCCSRNFIAIMEDFQGTWLNPVAALVRGRLLAAGCWLLLAAPGGGRAP